MFVCIFILPLVSLAGATAHCPEDDNLASLSKQLQNLAEIFDSQKNPEMARYYKQLDMTYDPEIGARSSYFQFSENTVEVDAEERSAVSSYFAIFPPGQKVQFRRSNVSSFHISWVRGPPIRFCILDEESETVSHVSLCDVLEDPNCRMMLVIPRNTLVAVEILSDCDFSLFTVSATPALQRNEFVPVDRDELLEKYPKLRDQIQHVYSKRLFSYTERSCLKARR